jgi:aspartyl-tRNA(Asn)/glutamyl-tRNA(Gln) amidotransferase subunit B
MLNDNIWIEQHHARRCPNCRTQKKHRFMKDYGLSAYDASVLIAERIRADYYEIRRQGPRCQTGRELGAE